MSTVHYLLIDVKWRIYGSEKWVTNGSYDNLWAVQCQDIIETILDYCQVHPHEQISRRFQSKLRDFLSQKYI